MKIVALAGGVGGAKLADGLAQVLPPQDLTIIVNTGDDFELFGLYLCPDLDTVSYTLAGIANPETGWGRDGETWNAFENLEKLRLFKDDTEKEKFKYNLYSLTKFEHLNDCKYTLVAMGSILEFLILRYSINNNIPPEDYINPSDANNTTQANKGHFVNYLQAMIQNNIFNKRRDWLLIQDHLRDFRNQVHIDKELKDNDILEQWYDVIRPSFYRLRESFK